MLQTASGTEHARARQVTTIEDLREVWEFAERSPYVQGLLKVTGAHLIPSCFSGSNLV
ncbi:MAG: hypothetical protein IMW89_11130 [Ktedonobacteraceae bacterium]|nr:hypothetical protein [Ktedonobacteraceae bacterium]